MANTKSLRALNSNLILKKIKQLTTPLGIYQFGKGKIPDPSFGYCLDDNSRALIIADQFKEERLKEIYLSYILRSQRPDGLLYQFSDKDGKFVDNPSDQITLTSQDAYGETLWALLTTNLYENKQLKEIVEKLLNHTESFFLRAKSYALLGLSTLKEVHPLEKVFTDSLIEMFKKNSSTSWLWFEDILTYANAVIPWALWEATLKRNHKQAREIAQKATDFLLDVCQINSIPCPIGSDGWYPKGGQKAIYIQQPIDPAYMVCCLEKAYYATNNKHYLDWAKRWWGWFFGENIDKISLVDNNFACFDGITSQGVNKNQGAESNICFLFAYLSAKRLKIVYPQK